MNHRENAPAPDRWILLATLLAALAVAPARAGVVAEVRVAASADDAEEEQSGDVSLASTDLELGHERADASDQIVGMRFAGLAVPRNASIVDAWVQFTADTAHSEPTWVAIRAEVSSNARAFTTSARDLSRRPRTTTAVSWSPLGWPTEGAAGPHQRTPNLATLVQEVIDRRGWAPGNALVLVVAGGGRRNTVAFDGDAARAPLLHVEYVAGKGPGQPPNVTLASPPALAMFGAGERIALAGSALDPEDGDLSARLRWSSSRDGPIGKGGSFETASLSEGIHTITAAATDRHGRTDSESVRIEVAAGRHVLVGAGDIASCKSKHLDEATARLLDRTFGSVFTLGDNAYEHGNTATFRDCYGPSWGRHRGRTRPTAGNHDYHPLGALGYFGYFGAAAGDPNRGYYSYDLGGWHVVALNTECEAVGGCGADSPQGQWLRADLAANPRACTLAYWHRALFSSSVRRWSSQPVRSAWEALYEAGADLLRPFVPGRMRHSNTSVRPFWRFLYEAGTDVVVSSHEHLYERFAPQDPQGRPDPEHGIREFVVGTGGAPLYALGPPRPNDEVRNDQTHGVLKLTLLPTSYEWEFIPIEGQSFRDSGAAPCVEAAPAGH
jgi:hypothetical protein